MRTPQLMQTMQQMSREMMKVPIHPSSRIDRLCWKKKT